MEEKQTEGKSTRRKRAARRDAAEELEEKCGAYFDLCGESGRKSTRPGLILWLGVSEETFNAWLSSEGEQNQAVSEVLQRAILRMRDELEQRGDTKSVFLLKQRCYGGYADRPAEDAGREIKIAVSFGNEARA